MERLRAQGRKEVSEEILFRAVGEQRRIEDEALRSSKRARRAASQRPTAPAAASAASPAPVLGVIDTSDPSLATLPAVRSRSRAPTPVATRWDTETAATHAWIPVLAAA